MTDATKELIERLREDAVHHRMVATECDCPPESTINWDHAKRADDAADALDRLTQPVGAVPEGYALVPKDPTPEMLEAAHLSDQEYTLRNFGDIMTVQQGPYDHWCAMLAAAPQPSTPVSLTGKVAPENFVRWNAKHLKTGDVYQVTGEAINATNAQDGQTMVIYERDGRRFVREAGEFVEKFAAVEKDGA